MTVLQVVQIVVGTAICTVIPGLAAAYFLLGERRPAELAWKTPLITCGVFSVLVYPCALIAGRPSWLTILLPVAAFVAGCVILRRPAAPVPAPAPPDRVLWAVLGLWALVACTIAVTTLVCVDREEARNITHAMDMAAFIAFIRELSTTTPARNPEMAEVLLTQPAGFWFWYAGIFRLTGIEPQRIYWLIVPVLSLPLLVLVQRISLRLWKDRLAAAVSVALLLVPTDLTWAYHWVTRGTLEGWEPFFEPFSFALAVAWYMGPPLILLALVLFALVTLVDRQPGEPAHEVLPFGLAALMSLQPFFHPVYFLVAVVGTCPIVAWYVLRGRLPRTTLLVFLSWAPFTAMRFLWKSAAINAPFPFGPIPDLEALPYTMQQTFFYHGLVLPIAAAGAYLLLRRGSAPGKVIAAFVGTMLVVSVSIIGGNGHWDHNPLSLGMAILGGGALAAVLRRRRIALIVATLIWLVPGLILATREGAIAWMIRGRPGQATCVDPPGHREAAMWVREHTPDDAIIATRGDSLTGRYVLMLGRRSLAFGVEFHMVFAYPPEIFLPVLTDLEALMRAETPAAVDAILARRPWTHVALSCDDRAFYGRVDCAPLPVEGLLPRLFERDGVAIYGTTPRGGAAAP